MMTNTAIVFPGQGSQSVGMLADIAAQHNEIKLTFDEASSVLGYDLWRLSQEGPASELDKTTHTQPALLTASVALWRVLQKNHLPQPAFLAGHSLGEYTALVCAQALDFADAVKLVAARGQFMQDAVAPGIGAMAAIIGLDEKSVEAICKQVINGPDEVLDAANFNSVGQVVISGHKAPVERALLLAKEQGAKMAVLIPVSVPSHCKLMLPAAERLAELLNTMTLKKPVIPVVNNVDVKSYDQPDSIAYGLVRQLYMPVRWVETINFLAQQGVTNIIECGPGKVLTGLNKRIDKRLTYLTTMDVTSLSAVFAEQAN